MLDSAGAMAFIEKHGIVLLAARGPVPRLTDAIAGEPISGSWWGHPRGKTIYAVLQDVNESGEVLFCRLLDGKVTLVHRRLWPALVKAAKRLPTERLAWIHQEHTASGRHETREIPWPDWVPDESRALAESLGEKEAARLLQLELLRKALC